MEVNADFGKRVVLETDRLAWQPSPLAGVERRMLDRIGGEVARATTIVRFAPESHFSAHSHGGGEEYFVLEGTFSDEDGDFPVGTYVRNPPGSRHTPKSGPGCTILVKLWQMDSADDAFVRRDTTDESAYRPSGVSGEVALELFARGRELVRMLKWVPGANLGRRTYPGGAELFVVEGGFSDEAGSYEQHTWLRLPPGSAHTPIATMPTRVLVKTGHLTEVRAPASAA